MVPGRALQLRMHPEQRARLTCHGCRSVPITETPSQPPPNWGFADRTGSHQPFQPPHGTNWYRHMLPKHLPPNRRLWLSNSAPGRAKPPDSPPNSLSLKADCEKLAR